VQPVTLQCILHELVDLDKPDIGNYNVYVHGIRPTALCLRDAICYELCMMPFPRVVTRSLPTIMIHFLRPIRETMLSSFLKRLSTMMESRVASYLSPKPLPSTTHLEN